MMSSNIFILLTFPLLGCEVVNNGNLTCENEINSQWRQRDFYSVTENDFVPVDKIKLNFLKQSERRKEPVSAWAKVWIDFVINDLFQMVLKENGYKNVATPTLDMSNLKLTKVNNEAGLQNLFLHKLDSIVEEMTEQYPSWSKARINQQSKKIITAIYQNILIQEFFPIVLGSEISDIIRFLEYDKFTSMDFEIEEIIFAQTIGIQAKYETADKINDHQHLLRTMLSFGFFEDEDLKSVEEAINLGKSLGLEEWNNCVKEESKSYAFPDNLFESFLENPSGDSVFGEIQTCMLYNIFSRAISGDMFWYDHENNVDMFTDEQLENIRSVTFASLICDTVESIIDVQPNAFFIADNSLNAETPCVDLHGIDLSLWNYDDVEEQIMDDKSIEILLGKAQNNLDKLKRFEYTLYEEELSEFGYSVKGGYGRPSERASILANSSSFYEFVTYELLKTPNFDSVARKGRQINPRYSVNDTRSRKRGSFLFINKKINKMVTNKLRNRKTTVEAYTNRKITVEEYKTGIEEEECSVKESSPCDHTTKYRTHSGRCNNLKNPHYGSSNTIQRRLLPSEYNDGVSEPRKKGFYGEDLPSPRSVSQKIHKQDEDHSDEQYTLMVMQWGQFLDHDISETPQTRGFNKSILPCKSCNFNDLHPACTPIPIPEDDSFYEYKGAMKCIPFTRSLGGQLTLGPREQLNQLTSYIDASMVYGNDHCRNKKVRKEGSFLLKTLELRGRSKVKSLLPLTRENEMCRAKGGECFLAGDERVNEHPGLTALHTVMMREHNQIATQLAQINPHWETETVYQETRRIVIAIVQHITYSEFLPRVLGRKSMKKFSLELEKNKYFKEYNSTCSASLFNEFSSAAFRFGHSMIKPQLTLVSEIEMMGRLSLPGRQLSLREHFHNPDFIMDNSIDDIVRGLVFMPMEEVDSKITKEVVNHLFEVKGKKFSGMDLVSLNLQRARDHGIPGYNKYREVCGLSKASSFVYFLAEIKPETVEQMRQVYSHPDDVDLFTGLMSETKLPGALVGPTLACILGNQFSNLRKCDRFWYESSDAAVHFTKAQLKEIRGMTMSGLFCRNCDEMGVVPRAGFDRHHRLRNPMAECDKSVKKLDLNQWREKSDGSCEVRGKIIGQGATYRVSPCQECVCTREGPVCANLEIESCLDLVTQFGLRAVDEDKTCRPQCTVM